MDYSQAFGLIIEFTCCGPFTPKWKVLRTKVKIVAILLPLRRFSVIFALSEVKFFRFWSKIRAFQILVEKHGLEKEL